MSIVGKSCPKPFQAMCCAYHAEEADNAFAAIQRVRELVADYLHKQQTIYDGNGPAITIAYDEAAEDILEALDGSHE